MLMSAPAGTQSHHRDDLRDRVRDAIRAAVTNDPLRVYGLLGVPLMKRVGNKELSGNCPFHDDKVPSFNVDPTKGGVWTCRAGCGGGDIFNFGARAFHLDIKTD